MLVDNFTEVRVTYPLLNTSSTGEQFHKYGICIKTNDSAFTMKHSLTWRRYSEFCWIRKILKDNNYNSTVQLPNLPTQGIFQDRSHPAFLGSRRAGLEHFIKEILSNPLFKSEKALHLFLQTTISTTNILLNILGKKEDEIQVEDTLPCLSIYEYNCLEWNAKPSIDKVNENSSSNLKPREHSSPAKSLPKPIKKVTFCEQVRIIILENASPKGTL